MHSNIYPLGELSINQIKKGQTVLKKLEKIIKTTKNKDKILGTYIYDLLRKIIDFE